MLEQSCDLRKKRVRKSDVLCLAMILAAALFSVLLAAGIIVYVIARGLPRIDWTFLSTATSFLEGTVGIAGNLINTLYLVVLTLLFAVPVSIGSAIYLNEYAKPGRLVRLIEMMIEILSGIPSIVFGLFGSIFFCSTLHLQTSILSGALTLTLMVMPLITRNTQEALRAVPEGYRTGAIGMGAPKWYMVRTVLLPSALPGILTGVILAVGRIVGESAALLFTAGSSYLLPKSGIIGLVDKAFNPGGSLSVQLYLSMSKAEFDVAFGIAAVLLVVVLLINWLAHWIGKRYGTAKTE